jgi:hypothetical protein
MEIYRRCSLLYWFLQQGQRSLYRRILSNPSVKRRIRYRFKIGFGNCSRRDLVVAETPSRLFDNVTEENHDDYFLFCVVPAEIGGWCKVKERRRIFRRLFLLPTDYGLPMGSTRCHDDTSKFQKDESFWVTCIG